MMSAVVTGTAAAQPFQLYGPAARAKQSQLAKLLWLLHPKILRASSQLNVSLDPETLRF